MEDLKKRLSNLLAVKSIVTVILTAVFADLSMAGRVTTVSDGVHSGDRVLFRHPGREAKRRGSGSRSGFRHGPSRR